VEDLSLVRLEEVGVRGGGSWPCGGWWRRLGRGRWSEGRSDYEGTCGGLRAGLRATHRATHEVDEKSLSTHGSWQWQERSVSLFAFQSCYPI
jgi:hypothetical protein